jgi:NADPH2:quinone reductase
VGEGVPPEWCGRRVWCYGAQTYRPFGTAAEYTVVPSSAVLLFGAGCCVGVGAGCCAAPSAAVRPLTNSPTRIR